MKENVLNELNEGNAFKIEIITNKNNAYSINFILRNDLEIEANQVNDIINKSFSNKFTFEEIKKNKYFLQFDSLIEIFEELKERINFSIIMVEENENNLRLNIPLPSSKNKEIIFELIHQNKNDNDKINDLAQIVLKQNKEIKDLKNEVTLLKQEVNDLKKNK